ncbi:MAG: type II/IV secretion system ATPase subunit [Methanocellales archaeon]|nr:type II/IV secretion system ATPase subunit [Methanocellales archaeon]
MAKKLRGRKGSAKKVGKRRKVRESVEKVIPKKVKKPVKAPKEPEKVAVKREKVKLGFLEKIRDKFKKKIVGKIEIKKYEPSKHGPVAVFKEVEGYKEVERYWVNEPYAFVTILYNEKKNEYLYNVVEPALTPFEKELLGELHKRLQDVLILEGAGQTADREATLMDKVRELVRDYVGEITPITFAKLMYYIKRNYLELGRINPLMYDPFIEDISCNGPNAPVFLYHKNYENIETSIIFDEEELNAFVIRLAQQCGKHISIADPMIDATMKDGSRIQMTLGKEVTTKGSTFTIRKFQEIPITPVDLINWNTFSSEIMSYFWLCIENNKSLIFAGGTASGKTSSLNAACLFIPPKSKIVTLEDTRELKLPHPNWIAEVTRETFTGEETGEIDMYELLRAALRQRPEYLLVGEVRGKEALVLFQAMSTGHTTFSTMHADSVPSVIYRLENEPINVPRTMLQALDIICVQIQTYIGERRVRRADKIAEITDIDPTTKKIRTTDIFVWNPVTDRFEKAGDSLVLDEIKQRRGWTTKELQRELKNRQTVLKYMVEKGIKDHRDITKIIQAYYINPEEVMKKVESKTL